jgi:hypothetical protein
MSDRNPSDIHSGAEAADSPPAAGALNDQMHAEPRFGRCPTDEIGEFAWRLEFRRRISHMRARTFIKPDPDEIDTGGEADCEALHRLKEKLMHGMRVEEIWRGCAAEELEGFEDWRREFRRRQLSRNLKI